MNITVSKKDLLRLITRMSGVADKRSTMPMLSTTLLRSDGKTLVGHATDLYMSVTDTIDAEGKAGSVAVNAADLLSRVKSMPDGPVELSATDKAITIKAAGSARRFTLRIAPADNYPPLVQPDEEAPTMKVDRETLASIIAQAGHAISTDETRAHLSSLLIEWEGDTLRAVATDGHRLSLAERKVEGQASATMLVPLKAVTELRRVLDEGEGDVSLAISGPHLFATVGTLTLSAKLTDAQFPPYSQVIPKTNAKAVRAPRAPFIDAVRAVSVSASAQNGGIKLALSEGALRITSESPESGEGFDELPVEYAGKGMAIGFNAKYLLDALTAAGSDEVELGLGGELDPMVVRPVGEEGFTGVVMPMRV